MHISFYLYIIYINIFVVLGGLSHGDNYRARLFPRLIPRKVTLSVKIGRRFSSLYPQSQSFKHILSYPWG